MTFKLSIMVVYEEYYVIFIIVLLFYLPYWAYSQNVLENLAWNWETLQDAFELWFHVLDYCWKQAEDEQ